MGTDNYEKGVDGDVQVLQPTDKLDAEAVADLATGDITTRADLLAVEDKLHLMPPERARKVIRQVYDMHRYDQNFNGELLSRIETFLFGKDDLEGEKHDELVREMQLEALLVTENSPYAEVRAVVDNWDDTTLPSLTFRVWFIGLIFAGAGAFINQLFSIRQPAVYVSSNVAQLLAWPAGKFIERITPRGTFLNPGPFNKKEHMLITIMAAVAFNTPYTSYIVFAQAMPQYFNQSYARKYGYQILNSLGSNFVGYGLAGLTRRFIVFPSFSVWPSSLTTLAINKAFHSDDAGSVPGPFNRIYSISRMKFFLIAFVTMFAYWWFPGFIFTNLSVFNWMSWIAPYNQVYNNLVGFNNGLGLFNFWPTFDYNIPSWNGWTPLSIPLFAVLNQFAGQVLGAVMILAFYYSNAWETGYLPINSNKLFDNKGHRYNVTKIIDENTNFVEEKYQKYSEPFMAAGNLTIYFWFFACYSATVSYTFLYHKLEVVNGFKGFWRIVKKQFNRSSEEQEEQEEDLGQDIHFRLMKHYPEVPEWWYFIVLCTALIVGCLGVAVYPTHTTPAVVIYGILMALIFVVPVGLITAVTGVQITMNVLAEFIGGVLASGDALAVNYFKMYGYITTAQAVFFASDLKLAHYTKIPPRHTFYCQMVATLVSTFICTAIFNFQMSFPNVCTADASFGMSCPGENTFFTAAVFWGTIGPSKIFGPKGRYKLLLLGFPVGLVLPFITFYAGKWFPKQRWIRNIHPVMFCAGGLLWSPYSMSYMWPMVMITWFSWGYIKPRYLAFWSKYNYVLAGSWSAAIAIAAIVIFFALEIPNVNLDWWGNNPLPDDACESVACRYLPIPDKGYFGRAPGTYA